MSKLGLLILTRDIERYYYYKKPKMNDIHMEIQIGILWRTVISRNLHKICNVNISDEAYFAIDLETNEILYIRILFDDESGRYYVEGFDDPISLMEFKNFIAKRSLRGYKLIKDIDSCNVKLLKDIQFGEVDLERSWFVIQRESNKVMIGYVGIGIMRNRQRDIYVKYAEMTDDDYTKYFGSYQKAYEIYELFVDKKCNATQDSNVKSFSKKLDCREKNILKSILNGDSRRCNKQIKKYQNANFIYEDEYEGYANVVDVNIMKFLGFLLSGDNKESFDPVIFVGKQIINVPREENFVTILDLGSDVGYVRIMSNRDYGNYNFLRKNLHESRTKIRNTLNEKRNVFIEKGNTFIVGYVILLIICMAIVCVYKLLAG